MPQSRLYLFDNLKGILMFLVVFGHFLLPVADGESLGNTLFQLIYLFHMPFFIFISGLFAKGLFRDGRLRYEKIATLLLLAFIYQFVLILIEGKEVRSLLEFQSAPWYLVSLCSWYLLTPALFLFRPLPAIIGAFLVSVCSGYFSSGGDFLAIERTIVFLPWFVLGYYSNAKKISVLVSRVKPAFRLSTLLFSLTVGLMAIAACNQFDCFYLVYGTSSYSSRFLVGATERTALFLAAFVLSFGITMICPSNKMPFLSRLGENSLQVYVIHRLLRSLLQRFTGFFEMNILWGGASGVALLLIVSIITSAVLSSRFFKPPFDCLFRLKWKVFSR